MIITESGQVQQISDGAAATDAATLGQAPAQNVIINSRFDFWQRGHAVGAVKHPPFNSVAYDADRWYTYFFDSAGGADITRTGISQSADLPGQVNHGIRVQRTAGKTMVTPLMLIQEIDPGLLIGLRGQPFQLSFWVKVGANFSAAGGVLKVDLNGGTDGWPNTKSLISGYTNPILLLPAGQQSIVPTTTYAQVIIQGPVVPLTSGGARILEGSLRFQFTPVGTAGANDWFEVTKVQLNAGVGKPWNLAGGTPAGEMSMCERYYEKATDLESTPGTFLAATFSHENPIGTANANVAVGKPFSINPIRYRTKKWKTPQAVGIWDGSNPPLAGKWSLPGGVSTAAIGYAVDQQGFMLVNNTVAPVNQAAGLSFGDWAAEVEIV